MHMCLLEIESQIRYSVVIFTLLLLLLLLLYLLLGLVTIYYKRKGTSSGGNRLVSWESGFKAETLSFIH